MQPVSFDLEVRDFLRSANLSPDDLAGNANVRLFGVHTDNRLTGLVGLEGTGSDLLLRSLVVSELARNKGLGQSLVTYAELQARENGAECLYLLTSTEKVFFQRLGFQSISRNSAPAAIATTAQFSGLCPDSAHFMIKHLKNSL